MAGKDAGGVVAGDEAVAHAGQDRPPQRAELHAVGEPHGEALAKRCRAHEPQLVGDQLDDTAGTERPALQDGAQVGEYGPYPLDGLVVAAGEQRERPPARPVHRAGDRAVDDRDAVGRRRGQLVHQLGAAGGEIHPDRPRPQGLQRAPVTGHDGRHVLGCRQRREQDVGPLGAAAGRTRSQGAALGDLLDGGRVDVVGDHPQARIQQPQTHRPAHGPQPDEPDGEPGRLAGGIPAGVPAGLVLSKRLGAGHGKNAIAAHLGGVRGFAG